MEIENNNDLLPLYYSSFFERMNVEQNVHGGLKLHRTITLSHKSQISTMYHVIIKCFL